MRAPLHHLVMPPNLVAGMNPLVVMAIAYRLRTSLDDVEPLDVSPLGTLEGWGDVWAVHDGKHRLMASYIAGRPDVPIMPRR